MFETEEAELSIFKGRWQVIPKGIANGASQIEHPTEYQLNVIEHANVYKPLVVFYFEGCFVAVINIYPNNLDKHGD